MSFTGLLNQTLSLYTKAGLNKYGRESYTTSSSVKARVQITTKTKLLPNNQTKIIEAIAYVPSTTTVNIGDKVSYNSVDYKVFGKYDAVEADGSTHHIKLELEKWL